MEQNHQNQDISGKKESVRPFTVASVDGDMGDDKGQKGGLFHNEQAVSALASFYREDKRSSVTDPEKKEVPRLLNPDRRLTLWEWVKEQTRPICDLAKDVGVSQSTFYAYCKGTIKPSQKVKSKLAFLCGGQVDLERLTRKIKIPRRQKILDEQDGNAAPCYPDLSPVLQQCLFILGRRARHVTRRDGVVLFYLDHQLAGPKDLVIAANRLMKQAGLRPLDYPGVEAG